MPCNRRRVLSSVLLVAAISSAPSLAFAAPPWVDRSLTLPRHDRTDFSLGFGLGYSLARALDLKTMALAPGINHTRGARNFGVGVGIQVRIE